MQIVKAKPTTQKGKTYYVLNYHSTKLSADENKNPVVIRDRPHEEMMVTAEQHVRRANNANAIAQASHRAKLRVLDC